MDGLYEAMVRALEKSARGEVSDEDWKDMKRRQKLHQRSLRAKTMFGGPLHPVRFCPPGRLYMV